MPKAGEESAHQIDSSSSSSSNGSVELQRITTKTSQSTARPQTPATMADDMFDHATASELAATISRAMAPHRTNTVSGLDLSSDVLDPNSPSFDFRQWSRYLVLQLEQNGLRRPRVHTTFQNLTVTGTGDAIMLHKTVGSLLTAPFGFAKISQRRQNPKRIILNSFNGTIGAGEMCIVLGRPGSGCSTFLKTLSGHLEGAKISKDSSIRYSGVAQEDFPLHGEILYNKENESHFPHLTVEQTLRFAAASRAPKQNSLQMPRKDFINYTTDVALNVYGLSHARHTRVGNDFIRGVSGGERKRVSIAEMALTGAVVGAWDNSTRGLDSATALEFVRGLRNSSDVWGSQHIVAIYQASQSTYDLFDKAIVLYAGRQIYFGPAKSAAAYFEEMGWQRPARMTTGDFLTSVTNPTERIAKPGFETRVPRTPEEFEKYWLNSDGYRFCLAEIKQSLEISGDGHENMEHFQTMHHLAQSKHSRDKSAYRISVPMQIKLCIHRYYQRIWNDKPSTVSKVIAQIVQGLIIGSIFYGTPDTTQAFFSRGSVLFTVVLVNTLMSVAEIPTLYNQRPIVEKHVQYALYHPSCEAFASVIADLPIKAFISTIFGVIIYFLAGLKQEAGAFFIFYLFTLITMLTMSACFRCIAAGAKTVSSAMAFAGVGILAIIIYTGFTINKPLMKPWFEWISYINPISYVFEALLTNEVHGVVYACAETSLVPPYGEGEAFQCAMPGAIAGQRGVLGDNYVESAYEYSYDHLWRNFGIVLAFMVVFYGIYLILSEYNYKVPSKGEVLVFRRGHQPKNLSVALNDVESKPDTVDEKAVDDASADPQALQLMPPPTEVFTWRDVCYDVPVKGGRRRLLDHVSGFVKPGTLTALMGTSGAGKTTLLDVLANRTNVGVVTGSMLVNGNPVDSSFQRKSGYCQQQDVHLPTSTVREALQFSAILRQPASLSKQEKLDYVEQVIAMLQMQDFAEAIVGAPGEGLNIEQRKLLTIGVELAAKPALLLYLDEPTSGLDSQSSWSIISLLRRLADSGQAILTTIHQPSAILFQQFDRLLFLQKGGKTVYFGDIGTNSRTLIDYFEGGGARHCDDEENPAEYILEIVAGAHAPKNVDWHATWKSSSESQNVLSEIDGLHEQYSSKTAENEKGAGSTTPSDTQYAMPTRTQFACVFKRVHQQYWRTPSYIIGKLGLCTACALFVGFSFFQPDDSQAGMQNTIFSIFMIFTIFTPLVQQVSLSCFSNAPLPSVLTPPSRSCPVSPPLAPSTKSASAPRACTAGLSLWSPTSWSRCPGKPSPRSSSMYPGTFPSSAPPTRSNPTSPPSASASPSTCTSAASRS